MVQVTLAQRDSGVDDPLHQQVIRERKRIYDESFDLEKLPAKGAFLAIPLLEGSI